jgi:hypothetical protein
VGLSVYIAGREAGMADRPQSIQLADSFANVSVRLAEAVANVALLASDARSGRSGLNARMSWSTEPSEDWSMEWKEAKEELAAAIEATLGKR